MYGDGAQQRPARESDQGRPVVRFRDLSSMIRQKRKLERLTLEAAARQSGVSAATLSRLERWVSVDSSGRSMPTPDVRTLSAVADWLGVAVADAGFAHVEVSGDAPVPNVVEAHLRADRNLDPDTALLLARMFRAAYAAATESNQNATHEFDKENE
jgi:transcriptional regulator with XRE-family HTH domain